MPGFVEVETGIKVVTDSASSMTEAEAKAKNVIVVPLHVIWPDGSQNNDFELPPNELYTRMKTDGIPRTSGATRFEFGSVFEELGEQGASEILVVTVSGFETKGRRISITNSEAQIAAEEVMKNTSGLQIEVVDSKTVSTAQRFLVEAALEMVSKGIPLHEVSRAVSSLIPQLRLYAAFGTVANLIEGRRVEGAKMLAAQAMQAIKALPVIRVTEEGDLVMIPGRTRRTARKSRQAVAGLIREDIDKRKSLPARLGFVYAGCEDVGYELARLLEDVWQKENVEYDPPREAGPALGVQAGPGTSAAVAFWS